MSKPKINRTQSREAALQVLYCQAFSDSEMSKALVAVEAIRTVESLQETMRNLLDLQGAASDCSRVLGNAVEVLEDAAARKETGEKVYAGAAEGNPVTSLINVADNRREAIKKLRGTVALLERNDVIFDGDGFCVRLLNSYDRHRQPIDSAVERCLEGWTLRRLIAEDAAVLRLGATELLHFTDVPPKVILNEYIELAKQYGEEESPKLVNGVLDRLLRLYPREEAQA